jgi:hypothetical protein
MCTCVRMARAAASHGVQEATPGISRPSVVITHVRVQGTVHFALQLRKDRSSCMDCNPTHASL